MGMGQHIQVEDEHPLLVFASYRCVGLKLLLALQGAGPLTTKPGRWLARRILALTHLVVVRDRGSLRLLGEIMPKGRLRLAADGIFLPGFPHRGDRRQPEENRSGRTRKMKELSTNITANPATPNLPECSMSCCVNSLMSLTVACKRPAASSESRAHRPANTVQGAAAQS
jgi:hypothetical protein